MTGADGHPPTLRFISLSVLMTLGLALTTAACGPKRTPATAPQPPTTAPAPGAKPAGPPAAPPLTGLTTRTAIESFNDQWKALRAQDYTPDPAAVATIRANSKNVSAFIVVATWCPDTRRDLPRFFKIADQAGWPASRMKLLAVDRSKKDPNGETVKWNVTRVPTFIFLRGGKEIGRVTERPTTTLEQDIAHIVKKQ